MSLILRSPTGSVATAFVLAMTSLWAPPTTASPRTFAVLHVFRSAAGEFPNGNLVADDTGNLYGTTEDGGAGLGGTVFKLAPDGTQTVLFSFCPGDDCPAGNAPAAGVVRDEAGNLFGTTAYGGATADGVAFALAPDGTESVLHQFTGGSDGEQPMGTLLRDRRGNLFGTTLLGGSTGCGGEYGCGTVFRLAPDGSEAVLYAFTGGNDGAWPYAGLVEDGEGNLYGTASYGGADDDGVVFELTRNGAENVLHSFSGGNDGRTPIGGLYRDATGNLFGTTDNGGQYGQGTVFKLAIDGTLTVLHAFAGGRDGERPDGTLIGNGQGILFGTTRKGSHGRRGTVFEIRANGSERVLYGFHGASDGNSPTGGLTLHAGNIYGVTEQGGPYNKGEVFALLK